MPCHAMGLWHLTMAGPKKNVPNIFPSAASDRPTYLQKYGILGKKIVLQAKVIKINCQLSVN